MLVNKNFLFRLLLHLQVHTCKGAGQVATDPTGTSEVCFSDCSNCCHVWSPWHTRPDLEMNSSHKNIVQLNLKTATSGVVLKLINRMAYTSRVSVSRAKGSLMPTGMSDQGRLTSVVTNSNQYQTLTSTSTISKQEAPI